VHATAISAYANVDMGALIEAFASDTNCGLIALSSHVMSARRGQIINLAIRHRLPAIFPNRYYASDGGLMSYGPALAEQWRQAASYVDRILKGEKPVDLPIQAPTKYELVINAKTARSIGLTVPKSLRLRADEVIE
jgi:putative ABC transport system substrate-binding protein